MLVETYPKYFKLPNSMVLNVCYTRLRLFVSYNDIFIFFVCLFLLNLNKNIYKVMTKINIFFKNQFSFVNSSKVEKTDNIDRSISIIIRKSLLMKFIL